VPRTNTINKTTKYLNINIDTNGREENITDKPFSPHWRSIP